MVTEGEETPPNIKQSGNAKITFNDDDYFPKPEPIEAEMSVSSLDDVRVVEGQQLSDPVQDPDTSGETRG